MKITTKKLALTLIFLVCISFSFVSGALTDQLVAFYDCENDIEDSHNNYDLKAVVGAIGYAEGKEDVGCLFDGNDELTNYTLDNAITGSYSLCFYFNTTYSGTNMFITSAYSQAGGTQGYLIRYDDGDAGSDFYSYPDATDCTNADDINTGEYFYFCAVANDETNRQILYIDGNEACNVTNANAWDITGNVWIGARELTGFWRFIGIMDNIAFWNRSLTASEISELITKTGNVLAEEDCQNDLRNTSATEWVNVSSCITPYFSYYYQINRNYTRYDYNNCGNYTNTTIQENLNNSCAFLYYKNDFTREEKMLSMIILEVVFFGFVMWLLSKGYTLAGVLLGFTTIGLDMMFTGYIREELASSIESIPLMAYGSLIFLMTLIVAKVTIMFSVNRRLV